MSTQNAKAVATAATNGKKVETPATVIPIEKAATKKEVTRSAIEEKLELLDKQFSLVEQREKLSDTLDDLKKFDFSSDNTRDCISLDDGKGHKFTTYQPEVVKEVVELVRKHAQDRMIKIDSMLLAA